MSRDLYVFDNRFARQLAGAYVRWQPQPVARPSLLFFNHDLQNMLGYAADSLSNDELALRFCGNQLPSGSEPLAQVYAGHQFGGFSPQLGDGRALLLGEVLARDGRRYDLAFKGSGPTPFARGGDGKAAVGPMLREVLLGECMHALGIPTTRALAVVATGEPVLRERPLPGAVLTRVAASHLRVGSFQFFAAQGERVLLGRLLEHAIERHDPQLLELPPGAARVFAFLDAVAARQARLVAQWMQVGFIHGVMNTDNMTISGETIDYGPCAFLEAYDPAACFSSIDRHGRYAYGNQPRIARWNLARLAEALLPLVLDAAPQDDPAAAEAALARANATLEGFDAAYTRCWQQGMLAKLGLREASPEAEHTAPSPQELALLDDWLALLARHRLDFTLAHRRLAAAAQGDEAGLLALAERGAEGDGIDRGAAAGDIRAWLGRWRARLGDGAPAAAAATARINPYVVARNQRVEEALAAASEHGDLGPFERLLTALRRPYDEDARQARYAEPAPAAVTACYRTFCGT
jgi:uncharacterized protein YdiU (UPF0061 family)